MNINSHFHFNYLENSIVQKDSVTYIHPIIPVRIAHICHIIPILSREIRINQHVQLLQLPGKGIQVYTAYEKYDTVHN